LGGEKWAIMAAHNSKIEQGFALLLQHQELEKQPHKASLVDDVDRCMRAEKRYLRYVVLLYPLVHGHTAPARHLAHQEVMYLKSQKEVVLEHNKQKKSKRPQHSCGRDCQWESLDKRQGLWIYDPWEPELGEGQPTGDVYVCAESGRSHLCGEHRCRRVMRQPNGEMSCEISGQSFQNAVLPRYTRSKLHASQQQQSGDAEQHDGGDETYVRTDVDLLLHAPPGDNNSALDSSLYAEKKRQLAEKASLLASLAAATPKQAPRPRQKRPRNQQIADRSGGGANQADDNNNMDQYEQQLLVGTLVDQEQRRQQQLRAQQYNPYSRSHIQRSFAEIRDANKQYARNLCFEMFVSPAVDDRLRKKHLEAMQQAEALADRYIQDTLRMGRQPDRMRVYDSYMQFVSPLLEQTFSRYLSGNANEKHGYNDLNASEYFSDAILKVWKLLECTPRALDPRATPASSTTAAAAVVKPHIQLRSLAMGILYRLRDGLYCNVHYDTETLCVLSHARAKVHTKPVATHRFCFIPPHTFLDRLPNENEISRVAKFSNNNSGVFVKQSTLQNYYQSLVLQGLSLAVMQQYQLAAHMPILYASDQVQQQSAEILAQAKVVGAQ
jgi:hypothetical protein